MKLLLDPNDVVRAVDPQERKNGWIGEGVLFARDLDMRLVKVDAKDVPEAVVGRYRYQDGEFVAIPPVERVAEPPPAETPPAVSMRQARLALLHAGLLDEVEAALAAIPEETARRAAQIEWEYAQEVRRDSPWVGQLAAALGLDEARLDALFVEAARL